MDFPENFKFRAPRNTAARNLLSLYQGQHSIADVCIGGHLTGSPETQPFGRNTWQDGNAHHSPAWPDVSLVSRNPVSGDIVLCLRQGDLVGTHEPMEDIFQAVFDVVSTAERFQAAGAEQKQASGARMGRHAKGPDRAHGHGGAV